MQDGAPRKTREQNEYTEPASAGHCTFIQNKMKKHIYLFNITQTRIALFKFTHYIKNKKTHFTIS